MIKTDLSDISYSILFIVVGFQSLQDWSSLNKMPQIKTMHFFFTLPSYSHNNLPDLAEICARKSTALLLVNYGCSSHTASSLSHTQDGEEDDSMQPSFPISSGKMLLQDPSCETNVTTHSYRQGQGMQCPLHWQTAREIN